MLGCLVDAPDERQLAKRRARGDLTRGHPPGQRHALLAADPHVEFGIAAPPHEDVRQGHRLGRGVAVDVELRDDRDAIAEHTAQRGEDVALAVDAVLGHHRAVQIEDDCVHRRGGGDPLDQLAHDRLERRARGRAAGVGLGEQRGHDVVAPGAGGGQKPADRGVGAVEGLDQLVAAKQEMVLKGGDIRADGRERAGFVAHATDREAHGIRPDLWWGFVIARSAC